MNYAKILGTGSYLPKKILTNADLEKTLDTSDQWITERTGIKRRHLMTADDTATSMAHCAAKNALAAAKIDKSKIDLVIVATSTPDNLFPNISSRLHNILGLSTNCPVLDISAACAGFIYALSIADHYIKAGTAKHPLVIGVETLSRIADWSDRNTCILFGDGAGAAVLGVAKKPGIHATILRADGSYNELLKMSGSLYDDSEPRLLQMKGNEVFKVAVRKLGEVVDEILKQNKIKKEDIDWLVPHQANLRIIQATAKKLNVPMERVILTIEDQGNTSAASVPLALDIGIKSGRIKRGDLMLLEAFGAGFVWGAALIRY